MDHHPPVFKETEKARRLFACGESHVALQWDSH
jgi:hypothetical protein